MKSEVAVFWFRRDLRLEDNAGLCYALSQNLPVLPIFIFDEDILNQLADKADRRVDYIHQALQKINEDLAKHQSSLATFHGKPLSVFKELAERFIIRAVYCNRDYEPYAKKRDTEVYEYFSAKGSQFKAFKDQVIFDRSQVMKNDNTPYTVYTPYAKKWKEQLTTGHSKPHVSNFSNFYKWRSKSIISLEELGFQKTEIVFQSPVLDATLIGSYHKFRDFPALQATTQLGIALRFGTVSIRKCVTFALEHSQTWLSELIWREFFMQILYHFPRVVTHSFRQKYDLIAWRNDIEEFKLWCGGRTGYPIVDAGMRQLNQTGFMHNRVRMITASFLCKHLLIDWRWGEAYFAQKLNDYDLSANNGNWQWAAGSGCDAAPYFRVFNPELQTGKFDKNLEYVKKWIPEYGSDHYVQPMVEHRFARERALQTYKGALA